MDVSLCHEDPFQLYLNLSHNQQHKDQQHKDQQDKDQQDSPSFTPPPALSRSLPLLQGGFPS